MIAILKDLSRLIYDYQIDIVSYVPTLRPDTLNRMNSPSYSYRIPIRTNKTISIHLSLWSRYLKFDQTMRNHNDRRINWPVLFITWNNILAKYCNHTGKSERFLQPRIKDSHLKSQPSCVMYIWSLTVKPKRKGEPIRICNSIQRRLYQIYRRRYLAKRYL